MKKLLIAATIVCAAVVAQASTAQWSFSGDIYGFDDPDSDGYAYGTAFIVALGATGSVGDLAIDTDGNLVLGNNGANLVASSDIIDGSMKTTSSEITAANNYALVLYDDDSKKWDVLGAYEIVPSSSDITTTDTISFSTLAGVSELQLTQDPVATPEPTSGLLLLLGVAGLALRRRRA